jgi:outer membrane protein insertion porin family
MSYKYSRHLRKLIFSVFCGLVFLYPSLSLCQDFGLDLPVVEEIIILGNKTYDDNTLKEKMRTREKSFYHFIKKPRFRRDFLRRDVDAIKTFYHHNGFFDVEVRIESLDHHREKNTVSIRLMINEGPQTMVRSVGFTDQDIVTEEKLLKGLKLREGKPYNPNLLEVDRYTIFRKFFEKGFLGTSIEVAAKVDSHDVDIIWDIEPGDPVKIRGIVISGNEIVKESLISRELTFKTGEYFDLRSILESKQNLYDTGYFTSVEIDPTNIDMSEDGVDLNIGLREREMGYLETGMGVGNVHGNRVFAEWGQRNLLGRGYHLNLKTDYAFRLFEEGEISFSRMNLDRSYYHHEGELRFPHVFSTWNTFSMGTMYENDETVEPAQVKVSSYSANISRRYSRQTTMLFGYSYERITRLGVVDERKKSRRRSLHFSYTKDTRDFYFNPRKGRYMALEGRYAGGFLGGEDHFYSLVGSFQNYTEMISKIVVAYRVRAGFSEAFGDSRERGVPIEGRFFVGGGNSVRGYKENSIGPRDESGNPFGGRIMLLTNVELRFPIPYFSAFNISGAAFIDGGNVWRDFDDIEAENFSIFNLDDNASLSHYRYSYGFGVRYNTPLGPIRLDVGFPLTITEDTTYDSWIHISMGQIF